MRFSLRPLSFSVGISMSAAWAYYLHSNEVFFPIVEAKEVNAIPQIPPCVLNRDVFSSCRYVRGTFETPDTKRMTFACELPSSSETLDCIILRGKDPVQERAYVPIAKRDGEIDLLIQRVKRGTVSMALHALLVGETVEMKGPYPLMQGLPEKALKPTKNVFIAEGALGMAGVFPLLHDGCVLMLSGKTINDLPLVDDVLSNKKGVEAFLSLESGMWGWQGSYGPLHKKEILQGKLGGGGDPSNKNTFLYIAGTENFVGKVEDTLTELGWGPERVKRVFS